MFIGFANAVPEEIFGIIAQTCMFLMQNLLCFCASVAIYDTANF